jgi:hypothetical protein
VRGEGHLRLQLQGPGRRAGIIPPRHLLDAHQTAVSGVTADETPFSACPGRPALVVPLDLRLHVLGGESLGLVPVCLELLRR